MEDTTKEKIKSEALEGLRFVVRSPVKNANWMFFRDCKWAPRKAHMACGGPGEILITLFNKYWIESGSN